MLRLGWSGCDIVREVLVVFGWVGSIVRYFCLIKKRTQDGFPGLGFSMSHGYTEKGIKCRVHRRRWWRDPKRNHGWKPEHFLHVRRYEK